MRKPYSTTLEEETIKDLKIQAAKKNRRSNEIIEEALKDYFEKKKTK